jgi:hypothetical protein
VCLPQGWYFSAWSAFSSGNGACLLLQVNQLADWLGVSSLDMDIASPEFVA